MFPPSTSLTTPPHHKCWSYFNLLNRRAVKMQQVSNHVRSNLYLNAVLIQALRTDARKQWNRRMH